MSENCNRQEIQTHTHDLKSVTVTLTNGINAVSKTCEPSFVKIR